MWDVFAVSTYFTVSVLFWYMGLIPDLAVMRDRAKTKIRKFGYGLFALGWTGSNRHWSNYEKAYLILAGLSTPLVLSVHSIVSLDFAVSQLPGWHTTIFPPYFVAGAVFSGFGMVLTLLVPLAPNAQTRKTSLPFGTVELMLQSDFGTTGSIVGYAYGMEFFIAWYKRQSLRGTVPLPAQPRRGSVSSSVSQTLPRSAFSQRRIGGDSGSMVICNVALFRTDACCSSERSAGACLRSSALSIFVNVGMWF